jgi:hypothetical protein
MRTNMIRRGPMCPPATHNRKSENHIGGIVRLDSG